MKLSKKYSFLIKRLIDSNWQYINIDRSIKWMFVWDDDYRITATVNRKTNELSVNIAFVDKAFKEKRIFEIEYFLLHEMRHIFQHIEIENYRQKKNSVDPTFIEKWVEEGKNYIKSLDEEGNENTDYFRQDCELDAYAFSFALMHYKYSGVYDSFIYLPEIYRHELKEGFDSAFSCFLSGFKDDAN